MKIKIISLFAFILLASSSWAQTPYQSGIVSTVGSLNTIFNSKNKNLNDNMNKERTTQEDAGFIVFPYISDTIDLRFMKKQYPALDVEDYLVVIPPNTLDVSDANVLMKVIHFQGSSKLIVWIVGNFNSKIVTFYIDKDFDGNFLNDGAPVKLKEGQSEYEFTIYPNPDSKEAFVLPLSIPKRNHNTSAIGGNQSIQNSFAFNVKIGVGTGDLRYEFLNEHGFPTEYNVSQAMKNIGGSLYYYLHSFKFGGSIEYQNVSQYTSTFTERYGNREVVVITDQFGNSRTVVRENAEVVTNKDMHSKNRLKMGLSTAYRLYLGENTEIQPIFSAGFIKYLDGEYVFGKSDAGQKSYPLNYSPYYNIGFNLDFVIGNRKSLSLGVLYNSIAWNPEGFFESLDVRNLKKSFKVFDFYIAYNFGL